MQFSTSCLISVVFCIGCIQIISDGQRYVCPQGFYNTLSQDQLQE